MKPTITLAAALLAWPLLGHGFRPSLSLHAATPQHIITQACPASVDSTAGHTDEADAQDGRTVFSTPDVQPQFPGGAEALMDYLSHTIKYPKAAIKAGAQGRVILQFIVNEDGTVSGTKVVRSIHPALDAEAVRVVSSMPRWAPGKIGGKAVRVKYTIPVRFQMPTGTIVDPKAYRQWKKYMKAQSDSTAALRHHKGKNDKKAGK